VLSTLVIATRLPVTTLLRHRKHKNILIMHTTTTSKSLMPAVLLSGAILAGICLSGVWAIDACLEMFERIAGFGTASYRTAMESLHLLIL
jgi:hypothetical protein